MAGVGVWGAGTALPTNGNGRHMAFALSRWRPRHLLVTWGAYWVALVLFALGPALQALWRLTRPGEHGSVSAAVTDGVLQFTVTGGSATAWTGSAPLGTLAFWIAGPPLLLWLVWLVSRPWRGAPPERALGTTAPGALEGDAPASSRILNPPGAQPVTPARPDRQGVREWRDRTI
jgi:hypothetical protein